jgi:transposase
VAEILKRGTRVTGTDRSKLAADLSKRYGAGESIRSLAASTGRSYGFIHRILTETGVTLRGRGGAPGKVAAKQVAAKQAAAKQAAAGK